MPVVPLTFIAIACLVALVVSLCLLWPRLSPAIRRLLFLLLAVLLIPTLLNLALRWDTTNLRVNALLIWIRILIYELCIVSFTLLRPRALTFPIAAILTLPLFASSVVGPASDLFSSDVPSRQAIGNGYFLELLPWNSASSGRTSGTDFTLFYQPPGLHFLRRPFMGYRLYDTQCQTGNTTAAVDLHTAHIAVHCPPLSSNPADPPSGVNLDYLIPRGARSPALASIHSR